MCKAKIYIEQLKEVYQTIDSDIQRLKNEEKIANLFDLDMLHEIENTNFNASQGYKFAKQIQDNRRFRRKIKNELDTLLRLKDNFLNTNMEQLDKIQQQITNRDNFLNELVEKKVYNPRVTMYVNPNHNHNLNHIPIPQTPVAAIHKVTREEIKIIGKLEGNCYLARRKDGKQEVLNGRNISNVEQLQVRQII